MKAIACKLNGTRLDIKVYEASYLERISGLMGKRNFDYGLLINDTSSIHTCFMFEVMDAIFLSSNNKVLKVINSMKPWRFAFPVRKAKKVLELPGGTSERLGIQVDQQMEFDYV